MSQVPTGDEKSNPADAVLYDGVAKALVCEGDAQPPLPDLAGESQDPSMRMLHYLIGTQLQRHLERYKLPFFVITKTSQYMQQD